MAATTTLLGLVTPTQGTLTGTWGDTVNYGISDYLDIAIAGTLSFAGDGAITLANTTGSSSGNSIGATTAQYAIIRVTGTLTTAKIITGPSYSKTYLVVNAATGSTVTFKASGQTGVSIAVGETALVYYNGTDYVKVVGTATAGAAGGSTTQVQYNNAGVLAGITGATTDGTALTLVAPVLGTPASGTVTNLTGTASININGTVGATTPGTGAFTTLSATGAITQSTFGQLTNDGGSDFRIDSSSGKTLSLRSIATDLVISADPGVAGTKTVSIKTSGVTPAVFSTTGLAVTGTVSATNGILKTYGLNGELLAGAMLTSNSNTNLNIAASETSGTVGNKTVIGYFNQGSWYSALEVAHVASGFSTLALMKSGGTVTIGGTLSGGTSGTAYSFSGSAPATSLTLDSSGNLGVGTSSPVRRLSIANGGPVVEIDPAGISSTDPIYFNYNRSTSTYLTPQYWALAHNWMVSGGTSAMTLNSAGNLGLGVTPSAWNSVYRAMQIGSGTSISGRTDDATFTEVMSNSYRATDGTWKYVTTNVATRYDQGGGAHAWSTAASGTQGNPISFTQAMTLDASGNLGVGTTSPQAAIVAAGSNATVYKAMILRNGNGTDGSSATIDFETSAGTQGSEAAMAGRIAGLRTGSGTSGALTFSTTNAGVLGERARIDSNGNLIVGDTSAYDTAYRGIQAINTTGGDCAIFTTTSVSGNMVRWNKATSGDNKFIDFYTETSITARGGISYNRAGGLVAYNVTSDYRAKDIYGPVVNSGALIDSVPVYMGKMKDATQERPMFLAHETPIYAHTGEKDAVDKDGKPVYQQMDASSLIPVMWAEIQSLRARVAQLESKP